MATEAAAHPIPLRPPAATRRRSVARLVDSLEREAHAIAAAALSVVLVLVLLPFELVQDSWLALAAGRELVAGGLPRDDALTIIGQGRAWVDQQWLAQAALYGLHAVGGLGAVLAAHVLAVAGALALAVVAARRLGGSGVAVLGVVGAAGVLAPWALQLRPQSLTHVLFVALVWLLAVESRAPSRRAFLALPLLCLWANLHGSVVLAAALVSLLGVTRLRGAVADRAGRPAAAALVALPWLCVLVSPYALELPGYYRRMLVAPALADHVAEWQPAWSSAAGVPFLVAAPLALAAAWLGRRRLTGWERAALALTAIGGVAALRGVVWFALAAAVLLPAAVSRSHHAPRPAAARRARVSLAVGAVGATVVALAATLAAPASRYAEGWPADAEGAVARAAAADPKLQILAGDRYADWLLWRHPSLRGRVAYDARFELLTETEIERLSAFLHARGAGWREAAKPYGIVVLDRRYEAADALAADAGTSVLYRDDDLVVLRQRRPA